MTTAEEEAKRKADEEEAKRKGTESDEDAGASEDEDKELNVEQLKAQLADQQKHIKSLNKESADRRKKLEEFEKAEAERKQAEMTEVQKAQARAEQLEKERGALARENQELKLQRDLESKVRDAGLQFRNSHAAKDAFHALLEILDEDEADVTDDHIKRLTKERDYLFGKADTTVHGNDGGKKGKANAAVATEEAVNAKKKERRL